MRSCWPVASIDSRSARDREGKSLAPFGREPEIRSTRCPRVSRPPEPKPRRGVTIRVLSPTSPPSSGPRDTYIVIIQPLRWLRPLGSVIPHGP